MTIIAAGVPPRTKPLLRGLIHELAFDLAASAGVLRVAAARGPAAKLGCALYAASLAGLLGISALYHRFVLIALAILLGWISVAYLPAVHAATAPPVTVLLAVGGGLYSLGALAYALRRPDPVAAGVRVPRDLPRAGGARRGLPLRGDRRGAAGARRLSPVVPGQARRALRWSPTRRALAMMVSAGFTAALEGKKLPSTT